VESKDLLLLTKETATRHLLRPRRVQSSHFYPINSGYAVATYRKIADSIPDRVTGIFHLLNTSGSAVDSASNRNEYRGSLLGDKSGRCVGLRLLATVNDTVRQWTVPVTGVPSHSQSCSHKTHLNFILVPFSVFICP
jgi:hypothetical protein